MSQISSLILVGNVTTLANGIAQVEALPPVSPLSAARVFHANGTVSSGTGSATINIEASCDGGLTYVVMGTINLSLGTTPSGDGFSADAPWPLVRANITSLSGAGATVNCYVGV